MGQIITSDAFTTAIDSDVWNQDPDSKGGTNWAIAIASSELKFTHDSGTTMASAFLTHKTVLPTADYSVTVKGKSSSGVTGVLLIGLRCTGPNANDTDRAGYYAAINFNETQGREGGGGALWFDDRVSFFAIGGTFDWDNPARIAMNPGEGTVIAGTDNFLASLTTMTGTFIEMTFSVSGDVLEFWADGVLIARAVDSSIAGPGFVRIGVQGNQANTSVVFDDFELFDFGASGGSSPAASYAHVGFDEARNDVYISVPTDGADTPRQFVYDVTHDEWYRRDQAIRSFGQALDTVGEQQLIFGDDNGYVNVLNATSNWTDDSTTFTGTWTSNWLDFGDKQQRKLIEKLIVDVAKATSKTTAVVTLETRDHPDGYTRTRKGTVHLSNLRTPILARLGGRYIRVTVEHTADGDLEIERILAVMAGAKLDKVGAR